MNSPKKFKIPFAVKLSTEVFFQYVIQYVKSQLTGGPDVNNV